MKNETFGSTHMLVPEVDVQVQVGSASTSYRAEKGTTTYETFRSNQTSVIAPGPRVLRRAGRAKIEHEFPRCNGDAVVVAKSP